MTGPFDVPDDQMGGLFNPFEKTSLTQFDQLNAQQAAASPFGRVVQGIGVVGKTLQPFAAPQQVLFGGVKALADLATGDGDQAWADFKRGGTSALAYLTYQHGGDLPGILKNKNAPQSNPITGYDLFKQVGAPQWVARWGGTAADFLLDVPILGAVGKAAKVDKLTAGLRIGENMARSFDSPAALRAFVGGVAAAPFTTQPIKVAVEAVPQGLRQAGRERFIDPILNARSVPRSEFDPVNPTVGQTLFSRNLNIPEPITNILERQQAVMSQYAVLQNEAASAFDRASQGLGFAEKKELGRLVGRLADESDPAVRVQIEGDLRALESRTGRAGLFGDAIRATNKGVQFDVFSAEKLTAAGLMSPEQLAKYQSGDQRHLRRVLAMYGERPEDHLRRIMDRNAPASVTFDNAGLERLYTATLNPTLPPAPPLTGVTKSGVARGSVSAFPSKTPLLDPAADAERLVWRDVTRDVEVGTVDRGAIDLGNLGRSEITSLRNVLGWNAVVQEGGTWKLTGGVTDSFPIGHPTVQAILGDLKSQGLTANTRVESLTLKEQVPNFYDPGTPVRQSLREVARPVETAKVDSTRLDLSRLTQSELDELSVLLSGKKAQTTGEARGRNPRGVILVNDAPVIASRSTDYFPVGHPLVQRVLGDQLSPAILERRGTTKTPLFEVKTTGGRTTAPMDVQRALSDEDVASTGGALYVHNDDLTAFMAGATPDELTAFEDALSRLPTREQARTVGRHQVTDFWLPVDATDPRMQRLVDRARGGGAALFDGATGQPTLTAVLPTKSSAKLPTSQEFRDAVQAAYTNADQHPAEFLNAFLRDRGLSDGHVTRVLEEIGRDYAQRAGIQWRPSDDYTVRAFAAKRAEAAGRAGAGADLGGRAVKGVTTQRLELDDAYLDVLGEVEDFTTRLNAQGRVAAKAATVNGTIREIREYLTTNNLIETLDTADLGSVYRTAGLRVVSAEQARALGNGFKEGEVLPAEVHRILVEQVSARKDAPLGLAWQWFSSRWQGVKLANPASIATNLKSAFVMANQVGVNPVDLTRGIVDYLRLHRAAVKGDGALDVATNVNGVNMAELFHHGAFTHNTLMNAEVVQQSSRLLDELANPAGSGVQRSVAALQNWLTETSQGATLAGAYRTAVTPMRWLGDTYGRVDSVMKGGLYMHLRRTGMKPADAARVADETFFNYQNVPYVVDGLRRFGLLGMPFASFKFLAAGRFFKAMYQNPYGVDRYYRLTNSSQAAMADQPGDPNDPRSELAEYQAGSPGYVRKGLYIPLGRDSEGRVRAVRLDDILPETAIFDAFNADGVAGTIPPAVQLAAQITSGKGYQGRDVYRTGDTLSSTMQLDPKEAARGVVASLWQFGAYPWAPGQPMTERIVKALADKSVPVDTITDPVAQKVLKFLAEGPAAPFSDAAFSTEKKGAQPVPDRADALARLLGVKAYPVTTTTSQPGSARSNQQGLEAQLSTLDRMQDQEMRAAMSDTQRSEIRRRYDAKRAPLIEQLRAK